MYAEDSKGKEFVKGVLKSMFWEEYTMVVQMDKPFVWFL